MNSAVRRAPWRKKYMNELLVEFIASSDHHPAALRNTEHLITIVLCPPRIVTSKSAIVMCFHVKQAVEGIVGSGKVVVFGKSSDPVCPFHLLKDDVSGHLIIRLARSVDSNECSAIRAIADSQLSTKTQAILEAFTDSLVYVDLDTHRQGCK